LRDATHATPFRHFATKIKARREQRRRKQNVFDGHWYLLTFLKKHKGALEQFPRHATDYCGEHKKKQIVKHGENRSGAIGAGHL
jgi:hypothetical protein